MNNTFPPFDNEKVRQAFAMAIDRKRIVDNFYRPARSSPSTSPLRSIFGYSEGQEWYEYNPEMAKQILTEEGVYDAMASSRPHPYRDVVRSYLPEPGWWPRTFRPSSRRSAWKLKSTSWSRARFWTPPRGQLEACTCWVGALTTLMPPTSWTITSVPAPASSSARNSPTYGLLKQAAALADPAERTVLRRGQRTDQAARPHDPGRARWFGDGVPGGL